MQRIKTAQILKNKKENLQMLNLTGKVLLSSMKKTLMRYEKLSYNIQFLVGV